ncbi:ATP-binding protein, partial [Ellagibacter isourolithinifaciens]|uniref:ATP-binding protein n=1 Tax=Ellagibacter isourolithinifaciens TaxID=2137581 RepID=UPI003A948E0C
MPTREPPRHAATSTARTPSLSTPLPVASPTTFPTPSRLRRPGEITLAHNGVLFLDELSEFKSSVLQGIRQPMETGEVRLTRADGTV